MGWLATLAVVCFVALFLPVLVTRISWAVMLMAAGYAALGPASLLAFHDQPGTPINQSIVAYFHALPAVTVMGTFVAMGFCVYLGGVLAHLLSGKIMVPRPIRRLELDVPVAALLLPAAALLIEIMGIGPRLVLRANVYLQTSGPAVFVKAGTALVPVGVVICGAVLFNPHRRSGRLPAILLLVIITAVMFGKASRTFAIIPLLVFLGGWLVGRWQGRRMAIGAISMAIAALFLLSVPLFLRGQPQHGLLPGLGYAVSEPTAFFSGPATPLTNALLGAPISMYVGRQVPHLSTSTLWTSINPAPSSLTNWPLIAPSLRLNAFEPYSALGELLNHGWLTAAIYLLVLGAILELATAAARALGGRAASAAEALVIGFAGVILIRSTQYDLRTESRLVYYLVAAILAVALVARKRHVTYEAQLTSRGSAAAEEEPEGPTMTSAHARHFLTDSYGAIRVKGRVRRPGRFPGECRRTRNPPQ